MTDSAQPFAAKKFLEIKGRRIAYIGEGARTESCAARRRCSGRGHSREFSLNGPSRSSTRRPYEAIWQVDQKWR